MNYEFNNRENGFDEIKKEIILRTVLFAILSTGAGLTISHYNSSNHSNDFIIYLFLIPIIICVLAYGINKGIKRQKEIFESYKLTITDNEVIREQANTPTIVIPNNSIKSIKKNSNGTLTIIGTNPTKTIGVPPQLENFKKLSQLLSDFSPINDSSNMSFIHKYKGILVSLIMILLMIAVYTSTNKLIVGLSGAILTLGLGYSLYLIQISKNIDRKTKKGTWLLLIVLYSIIATMYYKLIGTV